MGQWKNLINNHVADNPVELMWDLHMTQRKQLWKDPKKMGKIPGNCKESYSESKMICPTRRPTHPL